MMTVPERPSVIPKFGKVNRVTHLQLALWWRYFQVPVHPTEDEQKVFNQIGNRLRNCGGMRAVEDEIKVCEAEWELNLTVEHGGAGEPGKCEWGCERCA
jgi:hypothetical protein